MTTNDATRTALVDRLAKRIDTFCEHVGYGDPDVTREEAESYVTEVEEALLADRAVPEPDAAAGDDLDADMTLAYMKGWQDGQDAMRKGPRPTEQETR